MADDQMTQEEWEGWLKTRPRCIQQLAHEFPYGTPIRFKDAGTVYVVGWHEDDAIAVSQINPYEDFEGSREDSRLLQAQFFREHGWSASKQ